MPFIFLLITSAFASSSSYMDYCIDDKRIQRIPIEECGEEAVDARITLNTLSGPSIDSAFHVKNQTDTRYYLRITIISRILQAQVILNEIVSSYNLLYSPPLPQMTITLLEGFRPPELQIKYFERHFQREKTENGTLFPDEYYHQKIAMHIAPPYDENHNLLSPSVCCASQAMLVLTTNERFGKYKKSICRLLGLSKSNPRTWDTFYTHPDAQTHNIRSFFINALSGANLINYGKIHLWGYGDQHAALISGEPTARYGIWFPPSKKKP